MKRCKTRRKLTSGELDRLLTTANQAMARECQIWHPEINKRCQRAAGHEGDHQWRYNEWSKRWEWELGETMNDER